jgi:hypothetical protein
MLDKILLAAGRKVGYQRRLFNTEIIRQTPNYEIHGKAS